MRRGKKKSVVENSNGSSAGSSQDNQDASADAFSLTGMSTRRKTLTKTLKKKKKKPIRTDDRNGFLYGAGLTGEPPEEIAVSAGDLSIGKQKTKTKNKTKKSKGKGRPTLVEQLSTLNHYARAGILTPGEYRMATERAVAEADALDIAGVSLPEDDSPTLEAVSEFVSNAGPDSIVYADIAPANLSRNIPNAEVVPSVPTFVIDPNLIQRIDNLNSGSSPASVPVRASRITSSTLPLTSSPSTSASKETEQTPKASHPLLQLGSAANSMTQFVGLDDDDQELDQANALKGKDKIPPGRAGMSEEDEFDMLTRTLSQNKATGVSDRVNENRKEAEELEQAKELNLKSKIEPGKAKAEVEGGAASTENKPATATSVVVSTEQFQQPEPKHDTDAKPKLQRMMSSPISFGGEHTGDSDFENDDTDKLLSEMGLDEEEKQKKMAKGEPKIETSLAVATLKATKIEKKVEPRLTQQNVVKPKPKPKPMALMEDDPLDELSKLQRSMSSPTLDDDLGLGRNNKRNKRNQKKAEKTKPLMMRGESVALFDIYEDHDGENAPSRPDMSVALKHGPLYASDSEDEDQLDSLYNGGNLYKNRMANIVEKEVPKTKQMYKNEIIESIGEFREHYLAEIISQIENSGKTIAEKLFTIDFLKNHGSINYSEFEYVKAVVLGRI